MNIIFENEDNKAEFENFLNAIQWLKFVGIERQVLEEAFEKAWPTDPPEST